MDLRLDGKRALVTGSTAGIGYAIADGLAQEGADVIVNGRSAERVAEAAGALNNATRTRAIGIAADLGSADGVMRLVNSGRRRGAEYCLTDSAARAVRGNGDGVDEEHKRACEAVGRPPGSENGDVRFGSVAEMEARLRCVRSSPKSRH